MIKKKSKNRYICEKQSVGQLADFIKFFLSDVCSF